MGGLKQCHKRHYCQEDKSCGGHLLTLLGVMLARISAVEKLSIEQLDPYHSEDELKEDVDDEDVKHVLERNDHTVKDSLQFGNSIDGLQRSQHSKKFHRF